jgi:Zn-dependent protease
MALAGPAANLLLVLIAAVLMRVGFEYDAFSTASYGGFDNVVIARGGVYSDFFASTLSLFFSLNLLLLVFNLLPLPPLDGSNIPFLFLSPQAAETYREAVHSPAFNMIGLMVAWRIFGPLFQPIFAQAIHLLYLIFPGQ